MRARMSARDQPGRATQSGNDTNAASMRYGAAGGPRSWVTRAERAEPTT